MANSNNQHLPLLDSPLMDSNHHQKRSIIWWRSNMFIAITTLAVVILLTFVVVSSLFWFPTSTTTRLCRCALDSDECETILRKMVARNGGGGATVFKTPHDLLRKLLSEHIRQVEVVLLEFNRVKGEYNHPREKRAVADCVDLMELSINIINDTIIALASFSTANAGTETSHHHAQTSLSGVLTNHVTCMDGLNPPKKSPTNAILGDLISTARTALAVLAEIIRTQPHDTIFLPRKRAFPHWINLRDKKLLQSKGKDITADFIVSKDGTGNFSTLAQAVEAVEAMSNTRIVIYVKEGTYNEYVEVGPTKKNLMIVGDGMHETIFTGNHNYIDNYTTYNSYTLASKGVSFILQDLAVQNTAGAAKHQAVALRVGGDKSIINRCLIDGYQDTLYAHSMRQFYRDCDIVGTIDFIFGNSAAVFQNCNIIAREPMDNQQNMVTAQGRIDPNQNTAFTLQFCNLVPSDDLREASGKIQTFLGRPWKNFSRTMVMESFIDQHIDPLGWHEWSGLSYLATCWFGEFDNNGPGSRTNERVHWLGYHKVFTRFVASQFTVNRLLQGDGDRWVAESGVNHTDGL